MKILKWLSFLTIILTLFACHDDNDSNVVAQHYVHKYGFDMSKNEWQNRTKEGTVTTVLDNGVTVTNNYNNDALHGLSTYSFPHSSILEKIYDYDNGTLIKETHQDEAGIPYREKTYEPDNKTLIILWDKTGVPISQEQYENNALVNGKYFKPNNELEATIEDNTGDRIKRDRDGELLYTDTIKNGKLKARLTYHSNGQIKSSMTFKNYQLHGEQTNHSDKGDVVLKQTFNNGKLDGMKTAYRNNNKVYEVLYDNGLRQGLERHFKEDGSLVAQVHWENDKKHGSERIFHDNDTHIKWYYKGKAVSIKKFEEFSFREKLIADKTSFYEMIDKMDNKQALQE